MRKFSKILVPTDFSDESMRAMEYALAFGSALNAKINVLHVADSRALNAVICAYSDLKESFMQDHSFEDMAKDIKIAMAKDIEYGIKFEHDVDITMHVREGVPHDQIIKVAKEKDVDFIVMGAKGRTALEDMLMGSVASKVSRRAGVPVMIVR